ncbi:hypothetical protein KC19_1G298300 [Ceratodon purpureus]|uniref:Uncharacterized protein n=1 Tax=Ceratodon purpureus TaxID=3225 RepID=A0A8T0JAT4_CERPU|nr:hypothetical protein KC19_1G298300 [Ceratodon purpureus]
MTTVPSVSPFGTLLIGPVSTLLTISIMSDISAPFSIPTPVPISAPLSVIASFSVPPAISSIITSMCPIIGLGAMMPVNRRPGSRTRSKPPFLPIPVIHFPVALSLPIPLPLPFPVFISSPVAISVPLPHSVPLPVTVTTPVSLPSSIHQLWTGCGGGGCGLGW